MNNVLKMTALSVVSAALLVSTGCASKRSNSSEVVVAPMGVPGNAAYTQAGAGGSLVNNSAEIQQAAQSMRGVVHFAFDSSAISPQAAAVLNEQVGFLADNPTARVLIAGHTDEIGSREYNHALGQRRAQSVKDFLAAKGIEGVRVETISYGEERPAVVGSSAAAHAENRRAELSY